MKQTATESFQEPAPAFSSYICAFAVALCLCAPGCDRPTSSSETEVATDLQRPNVLIIMWDTVRADRLSAYGYDLPTTPFLEEFAQDAALYENVVAPGIWTLPSHASLFTGLPTSAHGTTVSHKWLDNGIPRLPEILSRHGYETYLFSSNSYVSNGTNLDAGFAKIDYLWDERSTLQTMRHTLRKMDRRDRSNSFAVRVDNRRMHKGPVDIPLFGDSLTQSGPVITIAFEEWLGERDPSRSFFAFLSYMEAHVPRIPSMHARKQVMSPEQIEASFAVDQDQVLLMSYMFGRHNYSEAEWDVINRVYDASLIDLDLSPWKRTFRAIESKGEKLILASDGRHELYDLRNDPDERRNLYGESQESAGRLQAALSSWLASFPHYDAAAASSETPPILTPEEEERLKALGY